MSAPNKHDEIIQALKERQERDAEVFENAISEAGFGTFNYLLLLVSFPGTAAIIFASSTVSYIMPSAQCDLKLSLNDKGLLNGITYAGMITSALPWALLSDTRGRRKVLIYAHLLDAIFIVISATTQSFIQLLILKFLSGISICGGYSALMTYISELHSKKYRVHVILLTGVLLTISATALPGLATAIIPFDWEFYMIGLRFHSWQLFLLVSAIPSIIVFIVFIFFPESPKYHMFKGEYEIAHQTFSKIFAMNTRRPPEEYAVPSFGPDEKIESIGNMVMSILRDGFLQLKPMFKAEFFWLSLCVYGVDVCVLMCQNTVRLWLPQLFATIEEYESKHSGAASMCTILEYNVNSTGRATQNMTTCYIHITAKSYLNNFIVNFTSLLGFLVGFIVINYLGAKIILSSTLLISTICGFCTYFSTSKAAIVTTTSLYLAMENIASTSVINAAVSLFPTQMRNTIVSFTMMFGRIGSVVGNFLFPHLMALGCIVPIAWITVIGLVGFVASLFLPNPSKAVFK